MSQREELREKVFNGSREIEYCHNGQRVIATGENDYSDYMGLFSVVSAVLEQANEIRMAGYNPWIDIRHLVHNDNKLFKKEEFNDSNPWDVFFKQPDISPIDGGEIKRDRVLNKNYKANNGFNIYDALNTRQAQEYWGTIIKDNLTLSDELQTEVDCLKKELFREERVLGVAIRTAYRFGGMQKKLIYDGHPVVGSCEEYIDLISEQLQKGGYHKFFLMIDDREYHSKLYRYFGNRMLSIDRRLAHYFDEGEPICKNGRGWKEDLLQEREGYSEKQNMIDYLLEVYLLAECAGLYCTNGTGQIFSFLINDGRYDFFEIEDRGRYHFL